MTPTDYPALEQVTWANRQGFTGTHALGDRHFGDSRLFYELFVAGYAAFEPESAFVAEDERGAVVGYLVGTLSEGRYQRWQVLHHLPRLLLRLIRLSVNRRTRSIVHTVLGLRHMASAYGAEPQTTPQQAQFPASLHINLLPATQGQGVGTRLLQAFEARLRAHNVPGIQLSTTNYLPAALPFYLARGFHEVRRTSVRHPFLDTFVVYDLVKALPVGATAR
jgi:GNAT superfamily N-acetyltransferase